MSSTQANNTINVLWLVTAIALIIFMIFLVPVHWGEHAISDKGIFSFLTIILLCISLVIVFKACIENIYPSHRLYLYALAYCLLIYVLREADFHRLFTDEHVTKMKFYKHPDIHLQQKLVAGVPMALFFISALFLIAKYSKLILKNILNKTPWSIAVFMWGVTFVLSQLIDKSDLNDIYQGRAGEEILEVCASGYVLLAVLQSLLPKMKSLQSKDS